MDGIDARTDTRIDTGRILIPPEAVRAVVEAGRRLHAQGLVQATSGNISVRLSPDRLALTRSGTHKGFLDADGVMAVDLHGAPLTPGRPSAETGLHCQIYRLRADAGAVVHCHSVAGTVLSMLGGDAITFTGYELVKAFPGQPTHDVTLALPIVENDQDVARLAASVEAIIRDGLAPLGYMIRGHGAYVWGRDMDQALAQMEALEFLLSCELERRHIR